MGIIRDYLFLRAGVFFPAFSVSGLDDENRSTFFKSVVELRRCGSK